MWAARLHGVGDIRLSREPVPAAPAGSATVRVTAVGLCGSDLHWYDEAGIGDARLDRPLVLGHEFAGVVEDGPLVGTRVAVDPALPCGHCATCLSGERHLCPSVRFAGHGGVDGALREFVTWPESLLHPLPPTLTDADGAMLEPLGVAIHAFDLGHVRIGASVAVIGCGPIGLCVVQLARQAGAVKIIASDPLPHRLEAAGRLGADVLLDDAAASDAAHWDAATDGRGVDTAFEVAGTPEAIANSMRAAGPGRRVVLVGIPADDQTTFPAALARRKGLTIAVSRRMAEVYPRATKLVERGLVDTSALVTARFPLDQASEAFHAAVARKGLKVLVTPTSQDER
jgi:L-iditol 2-dehydrogenase